MTAIALNQSDFGSVSLNIPRHTLRNMYVEGNPLAPDGFSRVTRPGLTAFTTVGAGPIYSVWRQDSTFAGDFLVVSGTELWRVTPAAVKTKIGDLPGTDYPSIAGTDTKVLIARNGIVYSTDGTSLTTVTIPDSQLVSSVAVINSTFILTIKDTQKYYWILPTQAAPDGLSFASAERVPDSIVSVAILTDEVWFLGTSGPEVWTPSLDVDAPFERINGRVYSDGCLSKETVATASFNNFPCLLWVTNTRSVVLAQGSVDKVSTQSEDELLKTATNLRAWSFRHNRHDFYVLTADQFTLALDLSTKLWSRWDSNGLNNFRAHVGVMRNATPYAGDGVTNQLWTLGSGYTDNGTAIIQEVSGYLPHNEKPVRCDSLYVRVNSGWSPTYGYQPMLEIRWSDDLAASWSPYRSVSMGDKGEYSKDIVLRSLGLINRPGRVFQFRFADAASFRLDYAAINEV